MKILIATPLYPPDIGGPAQYAKNLETVWRQQGHEVIVAYFGKFLRWPTGLRHLIYFFSLLPKAARADFILALDTFSVGFPVVATAKLLGKKVIIRTGGDFLWEWYVERTGNPVLLRNFYLTSLAKLNLKEKIIFYLSRWTVKHCHKLIFSTNWQRQIWLEPYHLDLSKTAIIENYYGPKLPAGVPREQVFLVAGRNLKLKNLDILKQTDFSFEIGQWLPKVLAEKIKNCYALIVPSLSEISPNLILQAVQYNKPFILSAENGLRDRLGEVGLYIDPLNVEDIENKIMWLTDQNNYQRQSQKVANFSFAHSWSEIADEFLAVIK
ncbi:MAG: glycosyltransferase family 4 protein [Candidatus Vogelbacteria bacterium]|nr:glycosyltransferase family 4 protein [Candidatus Vogelbacteria bacterium]